MLAHVEQSIRYSLLDFDAVENSNVCTAAGLCLVDEIDDGAARLAASSEAVVSSNSMIGRLCSATSSEVAARVIDEPMP